MPALKNVRHERYAQLRSAGRTQDQAYTEAGFTTNRSNAARLNSDERVQARISELIAESAKSLTIDRDWITRKLVENLLGAMADKERSPANRALELLGKDFGMFKERIELGGHIQVANTELYRKMTPEERSYMRQILINAAARLPAPANDDDEQAGVVPMIEGRE